MAAVQINIPKELYAEVMAQWMRTGHQTLQGYVIHLIHEDLKRGVPSDPRALRRLPREVKSFLKARRPATPSRQNGNRTKAAEPIQKIRKRLLDGMVSYMKATEDPGYGYACGYQMKHIHRCAAIIDAFLAELSTAPKAEPERVFKATERAVTKLNKLNSTCDGALIETDQREDLCKLITSAVKKRGLTTKGDITETWRQW